MERIAVVIDEDLKPSYDKIAHGTRRIIVNALVREALRAIDEEGFWGFMQAIEQGTLRVTLEN